MMGISYAVRVYDIDRFLKPKLFTIYLATGAFLQETFALGYLFLLKFNERKFALLRRLFQGLVGVHFVSDIILPDLGTCSLLKISLLKTILGV